MAAENSLEDYPQEIDEQLTGFDTSVTSIKTMLDKLMSMPRNDQLEKLREKVHHRTYLQPQLSKYETLLAMALQCGSTSLDPLDQAKLDLMSAYTLNSLFWMYLVTQGVNPREHGIKQELERIRTYMNRVKEITDKKKAARLDKGAASRFVRNALYDPEDKDSTKKAASKKAANTPSDSPHSKRPKQS